MLARHWARDTYDCSVLGVASPLFSPSLLLPFVSILLLILLALFLPTLTHYWPFLCLSNPYFLRPPVCLFICQLFIVHPAMSMFGFYSRRPSKTSNNDYSDSSSSSYQPKRANAFYNDYACKFAFSYWSQVCLWLPCILIKCPSMLLNFIPHCSKRWSWNHWSWWHWKLMHIIRSETWRSCDASPCLQDGCQANGLLYS